MKTNKTMPKGRNIVAAAACFMKAGSFHHKCAPRGGASNEYQDAMVEYQENLDIADELDHLHQTSTEDM